MNRKTLAADHAESALHAIRSGEVDAIVVNGDDGDRLYWLQPLDLPYQQLFDALADAALVLDQEGRITFCNSTFCRMVGLSREEIEQTTLREYIVSGDQVRFQEALANGVQPRSETGIVINGPAGRTPVRVGMSPLPGEFFPEDSHAKTGPCGFVVIVRKTDVNASHQQTPAGEAQDLASGMIIARHEERVRVADQIQDVVLPVLNDVELDLEWLEDKLRWTEGRPHSSVFARLHTIRDHLASLTERARRYNVPTVNGLGLLGALQMRARQLREWSRTQVDVQFGLGDVELDKDLEFELYRLLDEILVGIAHRTRAAEMAIAITRVGGTLRVRSRVSGGHEVMPDDPQVKSAIKMITDWVAGRRGTLDMDLARGATVSIEIPLSAG